MGLDGSPFFYQCKKFGRLIWLGVREAANTVVIRWTAAASIKSEILMIHDVFFIFKTRMFLLVQDLSRNTSKFWILANYYHNSLVWCFTSM
jgi:hypothetical protein